MDKVCQGIVKDGLGQSRNSQRWIKSVKKWSNMEKVSQGMDKNKEKISQETVKDGKSKKIVND